MKSEYKNVFFEDQFNKNEFLKIAVELDLSETTEKDEEGAQNLEFWTQITSKFSHFFEEIEPEYFSFRGNGAVVTKPAQKTTLGERAWHRHSR